MKAPAASLAAMVLAMTLCAEAALAAPAASGCVVDTTQDDLALPLPACQKSSPSPAPTPLPASPAPAPAPTPAPAAPSATPPPPPLAELAGPPAPAATLPGKEIIISLNQQRLYAYEDGALVGQSAITSGGPATRTPMGTYAVLQKRSNFMMSSPWPEDDWRWYEASWVNFALLFQSSGFFIHDAPWRHNFGPGSNAQGGTAGGDFSGTHGCVNVPLQFERDLFSWAQIGTPVVVQA